MEPKAGTGGACGGETARSSYLSVSARFKSISPLSRSLSGPFSTLQGFTSTFGTEYLDFGSCNASRDSRLLWAYRSKLARWTEVVDVEREVFGVGAPPVEFLESGRKGGGSLLIRSSRSRSSRSLLISSSRRLRSRSRSRSRSSRNFLFQSRSRERLRGPGSSRSSAMCS